MIYESSLLFSRDRNDHAPFHYSGTLFFFPFQVAILDQILDLSTGVILVFEWSEKKKGSLREVNAKEIGRKGWNSFARNVTRGRRKEGRRDGYVVTGWLDSRVKMDEAACYEILSDRSSGH